jgi:hypothetical protein
VSEHAIAAATTRNRIENTSPPPCVRAHIGKPGAPIGRARTGNLGAPIHGVIGREGPGLDDQRDPRGVGSAD